MLTTAAAVLGRGVDARDRPADRVPDDNRAREARVDDCAVEGVDDRTVAGGEGLEDRPQHPPVEGQAVQEDERAAAGAAALAAREACPADAC